MDKKLGDHKHYTSRQLKPMDKELEHRIQFKIKHYAGDVIYNINGFLDKNKDTLFQDFKRLLYQSNNSVISKMWPEGAQNILKVQRWCVPGYIIIYYKFSVKCRYTISFIWRRSYLIISAYYFF